MIAHLVNRCHVGESNRQVLRFIISHLKQGYAAWQAMGREQRRLVMRAAFEIHRENRETYRAVMNGTFDPGD